MNYITVGLSFRVGIRNTEDINLYKDVDMMNGETIPDDVKVDGIVDNH